MVFNFRPITQEFIRVTRSPLLTIDREKEIYKYFYYQILLFFLTMIAAQLVGETWRLHTKSFYNILNRRLSS